AMLVLGWWLAPITLFHLVPLSFDALSWRQLLPASSRPDAVSVVWMRWIRQCAVAGRRGRRRHRRRAARSSARRSGREGGGRHGRRHHGRGGDPAHLRHGRGDVAGGPIERISRDRGGVG